VVLVDKLDELDAGFSASILSISKRRIMGP
jgi:hypothetical protein